MRKAVIIVLAVVSAAAFFSIYEVKVMPKSPDTKKCSEGWRTTGYFTPVETDYASGETTDVEVKDVGTFGFDSAFVRTVFNEEKGFGEGWGRTRFGWYLGNYDGAWHKADAPLDAHNTPLRTNSVAIDTSLIPNGSIIHIPGLPGEYGTRSYVGNDVGVTVHGKHIDIYTGEGKEAEREMYRVTFEEDGELQEVCVQPPTTK